MKLRLSVTLIVIFVCNALLASVQETLPSWHWAYDYIETLQKRGYLLGLYQHSQPYTKGELAEALTVLAKSDKIMTTFEQKILSKLQNEFKDEIMFLKNPEKPGYQIQAGARLQGDIDRFQSDEASFKGIYRTQALVQISDKIAIYNGVNFDQYLVDDPFYQGKEWRGGAAYNEQAYITGEWGRFQIKFGRDFLEWGTGRTGTLLFSNIAQPMDQLSFKMHLDPFQYNHIHAQLDPMDGVFYTSDSLTQIKGKANRYISAHRVNLHLFENRLECSVTEGLLYSGLSEPVDFSYMNPFMIYYGAQINKSDKANMFTSFDIQYHLRNNVSFYGSLLIDDIQVEKTGPGDLEPNEIGYLVGAHWADPFNLSGFSIAGEYVRVTNRTYKTPHPWESLLHRNQPLGHPLGNDFDLWFLELSKWWMGNLNVKVNYQALRKGEGSIYTPWDSPWMDYTVEQGYSEPFPTGIVENRNIFGVEFKYHPSIHWGLQGFVRFQNRENAGHVEGINDDKTLWRIGFWWQGEVKIVTSNK